VNTQALLVRRECEPLQEQHSVDVCFGSEVFASTKHQRIAALLRLFLVTESQN
jgi:hypothetical protein